MPYLDRVSYERKGFQKKTDEVSGAKDTNLCVSDFQISLHMSYVCHFFICHIIITTCTSPLLHATIVKI